MSIGIDEVYLASDGADGLHQALLHHPEIVLSDVRMPKMTGIEMMNRIHEKQPDTIFIFMSGYSDKDYLKAAIRLQAVSYVEKPLDPDEIRNAVKEAVSRSLHIEQSRRAESVSDSVSASHLALCLTMPYSTAKTSIKDLSAKYCRRYGSAELFHSAFTIILNIDSRIELIPDFLAKITENLHAGIRPHHMHVISAEKKPNLFVFHIFRKDSFSSPTVRSVTEQLCRYLTDYKNWYITAGSIVSGINKLYDSYSSAVILLQHAFFCAPGTILTPDEWNPDGQTSPAEAGSIAENLISALKNPDRKTIESLEQQLFDSLSRSSLMQRSVQTLYYRIVSAVTEERKLRQLPGAGLPESAEDSLDALSRCFSLSEMHDMLCQMTDTFIKDIDNYVPENSSVYLIKNYIRSHYSDPMLSTKEISEYASLSASYACTVFKNETGQTLNQYLTEFRLEHAKELLADPRNNISDVASRVGYNDSNYFGKAFKKFTGLSPSEYREALV